MTHKHTITKEELEKVLRDIKCVSCHNDTLEGQGYHLPDFITLTFDDEKQPQAPPLPEMLPKVVADNPKGAPATQDVVKAMNEDRQTINQLREVIKWILENK